MNWTCEQTESRLSDYLDGLLQPEEQCAIDAHVSHCERCTTLVSSVGHLLTNMHSMEQLETPPRLVYVILDKTLGPRETVTGWRAALAWVRMLATPRFAYGGASLMATFLILASASGFSWRKPKLADLRPANVYHNADRSAHLVYARTTKYVSDMRVVYEIQSRLRQDEPIPTSPEDTLPNSSPDKTPGRTDGGKPGQPRQQNRATDLERNLEMLAAECPLLGDRRLP
jgi:anti-sigma factor RsiW